MSRNQPMVTLIDNSLKGAYCFVEKTSLDDFLHNIPVSLSGIFKDFIKRCDWDVIGNTICVSGTCTEFTMGTLVEARLYYESTKDKYCYRGSVPLAVRDRIALERLFTRLNNNWRRAYV